MSLHGKSTYHRAAPGGQKYFPTPSLQWVGALSDDVHLTSVCLSRCLPVRAYE